LSPDFAVGNLCSVPIPREGFPAVSCTGDVSFWRIAVRRSGRSADKEADMTVPDMTVIVAGKVYVEPGQRDRFIEGHRVIVEKARAYPGCLDVAISADPVEPGRVNLFEYWESAEVLNRWRRISPRPTVRMKIKDAQVYKHTVSETGPPFG
jgi:quinol monooxygenase YgiN